MDELQAIVVGRWSVGYERGTGNAILMFEFSDRPPLVFAMPLRESTACGRALCDLDRPGQPTPHRPS